MNLDHPTPQQISSLRALWKEAFGDTDAFLDSFYSKAFAPDRCLCATVDGEVAAAAYWFDCGEYAYIYAVATAEKHRGKGISHALMARIHEILTARGYAGCILVPGEESLRAFYGKMGYANFGGIRQFSVQAAGHTALRKVDTEEFAALRRQYLPKGAVVQEGENLAFLGHFAQFYAGKDCLVTATEDAVTELLGNADTAPGILAALGQSCGTVRTPGTEPFAMYRPLNRQTPPAYFGFAFD